MDPYIRVKISEMSCADQRGALVGIERSETCNPVIMVKKCSNIISALPTFDKSILCEFCTSELERLKAGREGYYLTTRHNFAKWTKCQAANLMETHRDDERGNTKATVKACSRTTQQGFDDGENERQTKEYKTKHAPITGP